MARRTPDNVTIQDIFDERTTAHNDLHRNRGFSPWQLLLGKTPTDKTACEDPDLAQCSVEVVDEAAKQRLRVREESYKAYIEEELSLRKRRKEIHQADLGDIGQQVKVLVLEIWQTQGSRMKGGVLLGPARVLIQERETTAEGRSYERCCLDLRGYFSCSMCCTAHAFPFPVREKIVQHRRHRSHQFPRPCQTFATHDTDRCS